MRTVAILGDDGRARPPCDGGPSSLCSVAAIAAEPSTNDIVSALEGDDIVRSEVEQFMEPRQRAGVDHEHQHAEKSAIIRINAAGDRDDRLAPQSPEHGLADEQPPDLAVDMDSEVLPVSQIDRRWMRLDGAGHNLPIRANKRRLDHPSRQRRLGGPAVKIELPVLLAQTAGDDVARLDDVIQHPYRLFREGDGQIMSLGTRAIHRRLSRGKYRSANQCPHDQEDRATREYDARSGRFCA